MSAISFPVAHFLPVTYIHLAVVSYNTRNGI